MNQEVSHGTNDLTWDGPDVEREIRRMAKEGSIFGDASGREVSPQEAMNFRMKVKNFVLT